MLEKYLSEILYICAQEFDVSVEDVKSDSRKQELVYCRKAFCLLVKEKLDLKNEIIAAFINRTEAAIRQFIADQPREKYYIYCLKNIRSKLEEKTK